MSYLSFGRFEDALLYVRDLGFSKQALLAEAGISPDDVDRMRRAGRVPRHAYADLNGAILRLLPRELHQSAWAGGFGGEMLRMMSLAIISTDNLGEALELAQSFHTLLDDHYPRMSLRKGKEVVRLTYAPPQLRYTIKLLPKCPDLRYLENMTIASGLGVWAQLIGWLIGHNIRVVRVAVRDPNYPQHLSRRLGELLRVTEFLRGGNECFLEFSPHYLAYPIVQTAKTLKAFFESERNFEFSRDEDESVADILRILLGDDFSGGCPSFEEIARRLVLSPASLRRRLVRESTSYQAVKDSARRQLAFRLLKETDLPLKLVSERVGFSEQSSFSRSFREWTGLSPREFRCSESGGSHL